MLNECGYLAHNSLKLNHKWDFQVHKIPDKPGCTLQTAIYLVESTTCILWMRCVHVRLPPCWVALQGLYVVVLIIFPNFRRSRCCSVADPKGYRGVSLQTDYIIKSVPFQSCSNHTAVWDPPPQISGSATDCGLLLFPTSCWVTLDQILTPTPHRTDAVWHWTRGGAVPQGPFQVSCDTNHAGKVNHVVIYQCYRGYRT